MSLSDRLRPDCEAAPWVIKEVLELERKLSESKRREFHLGTECDRLSHQRDQLLNALKVVVAVADRDTESFRHAKEVIKQIEGGAS